MKPDARVVGQCATGENSFGVIYTTVVECPKCYAHISGDRQEEHQEWHGSLPSARVHPSAAASDVISRVTW